ncbi:hypothetical protein DFH09DRAFT_1090012 [Mycena vulgaris]|nr:hypothetical protein DFH09DRAFT_1090012 [Mycena vulgaris]
MACTRVGDSVRRVVVAAHMSKVAICQIGDGVAVLSMCRGHPRWRRPPPRASRGGQREEEDPEEGRLEEVVEEEEERRAVLATVTTKYLSQSLALHVLATMPPESESGDVEEQVATPQPQHVHSVSLRTHKPCPQELRDACYDNLEASPPHPRLPRAHPRSPGSPASPPPVLASSASAPTLLPATMQPRFAFAPASSAAPLHAATPLPSSTPTAPLTSSIRVSSMRASSAASAPAHRRVLSCRPELKFWTTTSVFGESLSSHRDLKLPPVLSEATNNSLRTVPSNARLFERQHVTTTLVRAVLVVFCEHKREKSGSISPKLNGYKNALRWTFLAKNSPELALADLIRVFDGPSVSSSTPSSPGQSPAGGSSSSDVPDPSSGSACASATGRVAVENLAVPDAAASTDSSTVVKYAPISIGLLGANLVILLVLVFLGVMAFVCRGRQTGLARAPREQYVPARVKDDSLLAPSFGEEKRYSDS